MNAVGNATAALHRSRATAWLLLSAFIVLLDQVTKAYITRHYGEFEFTRVLPVLDITRMHNVGAAFSFLASASGWQRWVFIGLALSVSIAIIVWLVRLPRGVSEADCRSRTTGVSLASRTVAVVAARPVDASSTPPTAAALRPAATSRRRGTRRSWRSSSRMTRTWPRPSRSPSAP